MGKKKAKRAEAMSDNMLSLMLRARVNLRKILQGWRTLRRQRQWQRCNRRNGGGPNREWRKWRGGWSGGRRLQRELRRRHCHQGALCQRYLGDYHFLYIPAAVLAMWLRGLLGCNMQLYREWHAHIVLMQMTRQVRRESEIIMFWIFRE